MCVCPYVCFGLSIENPSKMCPLRGWKPIVDVHKDHTVSFTYAVQRPTPSAGGVVRTKYLELLLALLSCVLLVQGRNIMAAFVGDTI